MASETWTDERLDEFAKRMDGRFDEKLDRADERFDDVAGRLKRIDRRLDAMGRRFESFDRTSLTAVIGRCTAMITGFAAAFTLIATQS